MEIKTFVEEWTSRGNDEFKKKNNNGYIFAFTCYFIAFNALYNGYDKRCNTCIKNKSCEKRYESDKINAYINHIKEKNKDYNPHSSIDPDSEYFKPLQNMHSNKSIYPKKIKNHDINQLFQFIYQVRCNLFHGSKDMMGSRDYGLIKDGAIILKNFFEKVDYSIP